MLCLSLFTFYFPHIFIVLHIDLVGKINAFKVFPVFSSHQQLKIHVN